MTPRAVDSKYACKHPSWILQAVSLDGKYIYKKQVSEIIAIDNGDGYLTYRTKRKLKKVPLSCVRVIIPIRCGKCDGCRKLQNDQWFARLFWHAKERSRVGFLTLTFNEETLKEIGCRKVRECIPEDDNRCVYRWYVQPFIMRLRKRGYSFDYFCVSEKGTEKERFHFHIIFFFDNVGLLCNKQTGVPLPDKSERYKECIESEAFIAKKWSCHCRHKVKLPNGKIDPITGSNFRFQTNTEVGFQLVAEREWSSFRDYGRNEDSFHGIDPIIYWTYSKKYNRDVKVTTSKDAYGIVNYFESDSVGMLRYVTSYMTKCQHDGIETYHRQSQGIGYSFGLQPEWNEKLKQGDVMFMPCGTARDGSGYQYSVPLPRCYRKWFENPEATAKRFWKWHENYIKFLGLSEDLSIFVENKRLEHYELAPETLSTSYLETEFAKRVCKDGFTEGFRIDAEFTDLGTDWLDRSSVSDGFDDGIFEFVD